MVAFNDRRNGGPAEEISATAKKSPRWARPADPEDDNPPNWGHRNSPIRSAKHGLIYPYGYPSENQRRR